MQEALAIIVLLIIFLAVIIRERKVKTLKREFLIEVIILTLLSGIWIYNGMLYIQGFYLSLVWVWSFVGIIYRKYFPKFELWFENLLCKLNKMPLYTSIESMNDDVNPADKLGIKLAYYLVEAGLCALFVFSLIEDRIYL